MKIVLVHGFNVRDGGTQTIDRLAQPLRQAGHIVDMDSADYGWHFFFSVRFRHKKDVKRIAAALVDADMVITHSNGANYTHKALNLLAESYPEKRIDVVHFSPALDDDTKIPVLVRRMIVFATPHDNAVRLADLLWFHAWGDMGRVGYMGWDPRGVTIICPQVKGHNAWFDTPARFAKRVLIEVAKRKT